MAGRVPLQVTAEEGAHPAVAVDMRRAEVVVDMRQAAAVVDIPAVEAEGTPAAADTAEV